VMILVSYVTAPPSDERIRGLTFATTTREHRLLSRASWSRWDLAASAMVLQVILAAYGYFSSVRSGATVIGFAIYPVVWLGLLFAAAVARADPEKRPTAGPLLAGTFGSMAGFAVALLVTRVALRGLAALAMTGLLHTTLEDGYEHAVVGVIAFIASLLACPVGAVVGFARGYDSLARRRLAAPGLPGDVSTPA